MNRTVLVMATRKVHLIALTLLVIVAALAMATRAWPPFPRSQTIVIAILAALTFLTEAIAFELPLLGTVSLAFAIDLAALLYLGPLPAALVAAAGAITPQDVRDRKPVYSMLFNVGQLVLSVLVAGTVFLALGGEPLSLSSLSSMSVLTIISAAGAALVMHGTNVLLVTVYVSIAKNLTTREVWRGQRLGAYLVSFVGLAFLAALMAQLMKASGWIGIVLLLLPLAVARQTFQAYQNLSQAYSDTVRSLVAAIEAKDPYTRGHSERVAAYSRLIGTKTQLTSQSLQALEYAALLHDLGKIGVDRATLVKDVDLTSAEFGKIREHPAVGKNVLEAVEFLEEVVPIVYGHHERPDGTGYPLGLSDAEIPTEAKILAVADSFDAMTSNRAYRRPMGIDEARIELESVRGTQLDSKLVAIFLDAICEFTSVEQLTEWIGTTGE